MMKKMLFVILQLPISCLAQGLYDSQPIDHGISATTVMSIIGVYLLISTAITIEAGARGWESFGVFVVCLLATPLIAAILYAPYKNTHSQAQTDLLIKIAEKQGVSEEEIKTIPNFPFLFKFYITKILSVVFNSLEEMKT